MWGLLPLGPEKGQGPVRIVAGCRVSIHCLPVRWCQGAKGAVSIPVQLFSPQKAASGGKVCHLESR